ncbi:MAG: propionate--CoA ligase [Betaproteobacteria bacterium]|nr:propionate--CoA ligase [Betaproteobacteria bacterium]MDE2004016.1 propionate--CoA ligase [Betaproteobacteria bacterium]MDE2209086.1 propionate--CoA ligase [Betaproteobacteria bacterium]MDE2360755.1 propionate--CoA ligase [Betaproteobacteria bacterium]
MGISDDTGRGHAAIAACAEFHRRSLEDREAFWREEARLVDWREPFAQVLDHSRPPFARWFVGGTTNLCHNAVDRHLAERGGQAALIYISTETGQSQTYSYAQLHDEVNRCAAMLKARGVSRGDRVLIYMPMIAEAVFAMLACVRIGAIHSVVFGGFAPASLATRIDDARPALLFTADAGMRAGRTIPYKPLVDEALRIARHPPRHVILVNRGLDPGLSMQAPRDVDFAAARAEHAGANVPCEWLESSEPSYILYTSGTTGQPKGVQRDTGGYTVALASSMRRIFALAPGETMFTTSDIGWVVGHSYIVYGPLLNGSPTILYEGLPIRPDPGIWWKIVAEHRARTMFTSPTAIRVLKKQDPSYMKRHDLSSLRYLFLAGEPLDEPTARWAADTLGVPVVDNYWQTETGWPILSAQPGVADTPRKFGSASFPVYGYDVKLVDGATGADAAAGEKGVLTIAPPLPPGCMSTVWGNDERYVSTYYATVPGRQLYSTFDWATRDADGYYFLLGRTDDVINVAGHRIGTREIEEAVQGHAGIAEVAVVGVQDPIKGQVPVAFAVVRDPSRIADADGIAAMQQEVMQTVDRELGAIARPACVHFVTLLPKTRSGKLLRRSIQALAEGRDPGDLTTIEDPGALDQIRAALAGS